MSALTWPARKWCTTFPVIVDPLSRQRLEHARCKSYAGLLEFGLTACRRILSQDESYEMIDHLRTALREIQALPPVDATATAGPATSAPNEPAKASTKREPVAPPVTAPQELAVAKEVASSQSGSGV